MQRLFVSIVLFIVALAFYFLRIPIEDGNYSVISVADGDTITVLIDGEKEKIRLIGVDTPETHHPDKPVQCYGPEASGYTSGLLLGSTVTLEADPLSDNRDRYDRLLRYVILEDGTDFNKSLIEQGYGFAVLGFDHSRMSSYVQSQNAAENSDRGLWSDCVIDDTGDYLMTTPDI